MEKKENAFFMKIKFINNLVRVAVICLVIFFALLGLSMAAQSLSLVDIASRVKTPEALAGWLSSNVRYEFAMGDGWQAPEEIIKLKKGDCDDFAVLAQAILKEIGIKSDVVILKFRGISIAHAVCVWKDAAGNISFISNQKLYHTAESDIRQAILKYYPDLETIIYTDKDMRYTRFVKAQ
jgi:hypothetical protein